MKWTFLAVLAVCHLFYNPIDSGALPLNPSNIDAHLADNEFVFINFYADWCRFSNMLAPIWDETAEKVQEKFAGKGVLIGKVDCDKEGGLCSDHSDNPSQAGGLGTRFHITKYPTLKYVRNGEVAKREYRGQRSPEAFVEFIEKQIADPVKEVQGLEELNELDETKRYMIGYFEQKNSPEYENFRRVATNLKDDCAFFAGFGDAVKQMHPPGQSIVAFRPNKATSPERDETYTGNLLSYADFSAFASEKCTPLVREITFENAEELTEEGLPFLILFHAPNDTESVKDYTTIVQTQLIRHKQNVNFLLADGHKFAHPLHHLGKSPKDLPLIAIDSFRHMYLFPKYEDRLIPGKLEQFLQDLYSGKLHREYHYGPDPVSSSDSPTDNKVEKKLPPPSQFQHLGPSKNRYTILHDEF